MRFFVNREQIDGNVISISGEDFIHIVKVLRMKVDDELTICDNACTDYAAVIADIRKQELTLDILRSAKNDNELPFRVTLFQGLPKADKMELIIQKCTELGVAEIVPLLTERVIVKPADAQKRVERFAKIALAAAKQSERGFVPVIGVPMRFEDAICTHFDLALIPYEKEQTAHIKSVLRSAEATNHIGIFIGPEGGFSEQEIASAKRQNIRPVSLGKRILRTETAGLYSLAVIAYEFGEAL